MQSIANKRGINLVTIPIVLFGRMIEVGGSGETNIRIGHVEKKTLQKHNYAINITLQTIRQLMS